MLKINKVDISSYIKRLTGQEIHLAELSKDRLNGLALYIRSGYELYEARLLEQDLFFAIPKGEGIMSPKQAKNTMNALSSRLHHPVVLVLPKLPSYLRIRYIDQRIPFLVPNQQLFLPQYLVDLRAEKAEKIEERVLVRPATQLMILYHLLVKSLDGMNQLQISNQLRYSKMTISRAVMECRDKGLIERGRGNIFFMSSKLELWQQSKVFMRSPIQKIKYVDDPAMLDEFLISDINALAHYTDLAAGDKLAVAISKSDYQVLRERFPDQIKEDIGRHAIEVWSYDPQLLTSGNFVDPLSLYLRINQEELDARTSISLDQLVKKGIYD